MHFNASLVQQHVGDDSASQKHGSLRKPAKVSKIGTPVHQISLKKPKKGSITTMNEVRKSRVITP